MNDGYWHNYFTHTLRAVFLIIILAGLWLIYRYAIKNIRNANRNSDGDESRNGRK